MSQAHLPILFPSRVSILFSGLLLDLIRDLVDLSDWICKGKCTITLHSLQKKSDLNSVLTGNSFKICSPFPCFKEELSSLLWRDSLGLGKII